MEPIWCARDLPKKLVRMTSAGAGEKSVQDTHVHGGRIYKEPLDDGGGERTNAHMHTPSPPLAVSPAENRKICSASSNAGGFCCGSGTLL